MKKIVFLLVILVIGLTGCGKTEPIVEKTNNENIKQELIKNESNVNTNITNIDFYIVELFDELDETNQISGITCAKTDNELCYEFVVLNKQEGQYDYAIYDDGNSIYYIALIDEDNIRVVECKQEDYTSISEKLRKAFNQLDNPYDYATEVLSVDNTEEDFKTYNDELENIDIENIYDFVENNIEWYILKGKFISVANKESLLDYYKSLIAIYRENDYIEEDTTDLWGDFAEFRFY